MLVKSLRLAKGTSSSLCKMKLKETTNNQRNDRTMKTEKPDEK